MVCGFRTYELNPHYWLDGTSVYDALEKGLDDLMDLCDVVTEKFTEARDAFDEEQRDRMET